MNVNEVIANRACELLGGKKGDYKLLSPNDHVNMGQSTNDVIPTSMRLAALALLPGLLKALEKLETALAEKAVEFDPIVKVWTNSFAGRSSDQAGSGVQRLCARYSEIADKNC